MLKSTSAAAAKRKLLAKSFLDEEAKEDEVDFNIYSQDILGNEEEEEKATQDDMDFIDDGDEEEEESSKAAKTMLKSITMSLRSKSKRSADDADITPDRAARLLR